MNAYLEGMRRFTDFEGRATRAQFWQFVLGVVVLLLLGRFLDAVFDLRVGLSISPLTLIVGLAHFLPFLAISVRRLHDTDRSGWWYLVNAIPLGTIVFLGLACIPSTPGTNSYGPAVDPEAPGASLNGNARRYFEPLLDGHWQQPPNQIPPTSRAAAIPSMGGDAMIERLERLAGLRASGTIDETEFEDMKAKLLNRTQSAGNAS